MNPARERARALVVSGGTLWAVSVLTLLLSRVAAGILAVVAGAAWAVGAAGMAGTRIQRTLLGAAAVFMVGWGLVILLSVD